jgi:hypothetical protein
VELIAPKEPLEFQYKDVTFLVKAQAVDADRMEVFACREPDRAKITLPAAEFRRALVRCFVIGWKGVTSQGQVVPYSYEVFMRYFPAHDGKGRTVIGDLCDFILAKTDLFQSDEIEKNASRAPSTGSAEPGPSTAPGKTAGK